MGQGWETKTQMARPGQAGVRLLGARMPAFAFSKVSCPVLFPLCPRGVFLYRRALSSPLAYSGTLPAPSDRTRLNHGSRGPTSLPQKAEIPKVWSPGAMNMPSLPTKPHPAPRPTSNPGQVLDPPVSPSHCSHFYVPDSGSKCKQTVHFEGERRKAHQSLTLDWTGSRQAVLDTEVGTEQDFRGPVCKKRVEILSWGTWDRVSGLGC